MQQPGPKKSKGADPKLEGMGTRTPIRFGGAMDKVARTVMPTWERLGDFHSDRYLLYLYRKPVIKDWTGFVLVQGARRAGRITAELAISRRGEYPLDYGRVRPLVAVDGVRERVALLHDMEDQWWEYRTQELLEDRLKDVLSEAVSRGYFTMEDRFGDLLRGEISRAQKLMRQWSEQEPAYQQRPLGSRFPDLMMEAQSYEYIRSSITYDAFSRCLGPLRRRYADPRWLSCQTYLMASIMETGNIDDLENLAGQAPAVVDDEIHLIKQRVPYYTYLKMPEAFDERMKMFAFFKSLNIADAYFDKAVGK